MKVNKLLLAVTALSVLLCPAYSEAQGFRIGSTTDAGGGYFPHWDSVQDRLILYRDTQASGAPVARIFNSDGTSIPIYPLTDLPGAWHIDVWGVAATPEGGAVLTAIVGFTPPAVKPPQIQSLLLTYDANGKLTKVWNVNPYHHHHLAVDGDGNIFALGDANLEEPYPLIVEYSPTGKVLREFLSSATFPNGDFAIDSNSTNGESGMFIRRNELFVWLASSQELFHFSLTGNLLGRTSLASALSGLSAETGTDHIEVQFLTATEQSEVIAQVHLWPKPPSDASRVVMVSLSADGSKATILRSAPSRGWFLGKTGQGRLVFFEPQAGADAALINEY
jgi:hypothetical protein